MMIGSAKVRDTPLVRVKTGSVGGDLTPEAKSSDDLIEEDSPGFDGWFGNIGVVDNFSVVPIEKFEKLEYVVCKIYIQIEVVKENGLLMPVEEDIFKT
ncbi:hypothetical protein E3N88_19326 [Mikania micrantha]|uniref:Uncharacterized protein n=1 Tax=Mikania micrantha TaxID=192012 RepID=A0A5N6NPI6_9ASTR|nr:hypothetical protein E3N88_19326 [Mikania micrantha]